MTFKRLISYLKPQKKTIILAISIIILSSIISIFTPKLLGDFITEIYEGITSPEVINEKKLYTILITLASLYLINVIFGYIENYLTNIITQNTIYRLRNETNKKLSKLNIQYFDTHSKGTLLSRFNNDLEAISTVFSTLLPKTLNFSITFIGTLIMMFYIDSLLTIITLITLPLVALTSKLLLKFSKKKRMQYFQKLDYLNSLTTESYLNKEIISLYNNDKLISDNYNKINNDLAKTNIKASLITGFISPISTLINYAIYIIILLLGSKHVLEGKLKFGEIQTLIQYTKQLGTPINSFSSLLSQAQTSLLASKRIFEILDEKEETHNGKRTLNTIETIELKNVEFSYSETPIIKNINLRINKGEKIAIVGETGCGKSTIINLLLQFYKINKGDILINGHSLYEYNLKDYYNQISLVTQDLWLLNDSVKNNIKYSNLNATDEEIYNICKTNNTLNIINKLPNKFDEIIDENITNISEGEKQIFTISRALLKNHSLLVLDEATSYIDSSTEKLIEESIKHINKDKTLLIIAHKLSTITNADKIIVMKDGKIIEIGTHNSLYKEKGEYYRFIQAL